MYKKKGIFYKNKKMMTNKNRLIKCQMINKKIFNNHKNKLINKLYKIVYYNKKFISQKYNCKILLIRTILIKNNKVN